MGKSTISMAMFNSYVSLPEGRGFHTWRNPEKKCLLDDFNGKSQTKIAKMDDWGYPHDLGNLHR